MVVPALRLVLRAGLRRDDASEPAGGRSGRESAGSGCEVGQISILPGLLHRREGQATPDADLGDVGAPRRDVPLRHRLPPRLRLQQQEQQQLLLASASLRCSISPLTLCPSRVR
ncbi:unnamed protein product [Linum tenue]|uniref:Uncharacterized protein n=1 Tax=Linum tenue TaxID=586396 RepID=A0AAV0KTD4_9ROSI|nr:unnamed protein product [Linum tenue]